MKKWNIKWKKEHKECIDFFLFVVSIHLTICEKNMEEELSKHI